MALTLYSDNRLPCPQRVVLTAAELGLDLTTILIDITSNQHKTPEFSALNPFNAIPVLVDHSTTPPFVLRESRAICRYLVLYASKLSGTASTLIPSTDDLRATARFEEAASLEVTGFDPVANRLVFEKVFRQFVSEKTAETPPQRTADSREVTLEASKENSGSASQQALNDAEHIKVVRDLEDRLELLLGKLEDVLGSDKRQFMAGDNFTVADIFYVPYMSKLIGIDGGIFEGRENLHAWWARVSGRESYLNSKASAHLG